MKCGAHSSVIDPHFALPMENACPSHTRTAWIFYFPHLYVLLFILQYLLEDMREELNSEFLCILQQKSASHGTSFFLWYISLCDHIYMWAKFFFFLFCPLFFFFLAKGSCGSEQCLHCAAERKSKACCCNRHNMKASWKCEAAQPPRSD